MPAVRRYVDYLRVEQVGGLVLLVAAALALVAANSPLSASYDALLATTVGPSALNAHLSLATWAGEGLLALFFFVVGLEVKRELVIGDLRDRRAAALPVVAALGGIVVPALLYLALTAGTAGAGRGWAVPTATDIAFALAVLAVVGGAAPSGLRLFLLSLAVVDDLVAIALIAVLFTDDLRVGPLLGAVGLLSLYALAQRRRITTPLVYLPLAAAVWLLVHEAGVHATVAGIALGLLTRVRADPGEEHPPAERLEHRLQPWSAGFVVPVFAFTAAGVSVSGDALATATGDRVAVAVLVALVVGKLGGVLAASAVAVRLGLARLPERVGWWDITGIAALAGTGFTVSLLLTQLSFAEPARRDAVTVAVLAASVLASLLGAAVLRLRRSQHAAG